MPVKFRREFKNVKTKTMDPPFKRLLQSPTCDLPEKRFTMVNLVKDPQAEGTRVVIEAVGINEEVFYGSLSEEELLFIWEKILARNRAEIFGMSYKRSLKRNFRATFILTHKCELSEIYPRSSFSHKRKKDGAPDDLIHCNIIGFNQVKPAELGSLTKITATTNDFTVLPAEILPWLAMFGTVGSKYDYVKNSLGIRTDVIETEIKLNKHIPEFLPAGGRKIQVEYPGIPKMCIRCYKTGHLRRNCRSPKVEWIDRVAAMRATKEFPDNMFGNWINVLDQK